MSQTKTASKPAASTSKTSKLDALKQNKSRRTNGLCPSCGKEKTEASLLLQVRKGKDHISSKSRTLCESCTVEAFEKLTDELLSFSA